MNKILLVIWLVFATSNLAFTQTTSNSDWKTYMLVNKEFSLEMPIGKTMRGFGEKSVRYGVIADDTYFFVFSDSLKTPMQTKIVLEFIKANKMVGNSSAVGSLIGEKFSFADADGFYQTILTVQTKAGSYVFQTISEIENNPMVERFFATIQFNESLAENSSPSKVEDENITAPSYPEIDPNKSSDNRSGAGNDNGTGNGDRLKKINPPLLTNHTEPLKILSRLGVKYTDLARSYLISGTIRLRITFLASGEIGAVEVVKKLPFGLTVNAVNAARETKFEPAIKEGIPYSVTKVIDYSFSLY